MKKRFASIKRFISHFGVKNNISLLFLALIIACTTHSGVNGLVNYIITMLPEKEVTITVVETDNPGTEVWIFGTSGDMDLFETCVEGEKTGAWEYRDAAEWGYAANALVSYGDNIGSSISIKSPARPEAGIQFGAHQYSGAISLLVEGEEPVVYDLFSDTGITKMIYPFSNSIAPIFLRLGTYLIEIVIVFFAILAALHWLVSRRKQHGQRRICEIIDKNYFALLWLILFAFAAVQYMNGIPNYLGFGDQVYYWGLDLISDGKWDTEHIATQIFSFRGYLCNLIPTISKAIGRTTGVDPVYVYLLFTSAALSWLCSHVVPEIYKLLTNRNASLLQKNAFLLVYLFFWNGTLTAVLVDMFGAVAFFTGTMYALRLYFGDRRFLYSAGAGFFWAIACNFRMAYQYGIYVLIVGTVLIKVYSYFKNRKEKEIINRSMLRREVTKGAIGILCFSAAFVLISFPQYLINVKKGGSGFLPFDSFGAWNDFNGDPCTLLMFSANYSLQAYSGYPYPVFDNQMLSLKTQLYESNSVLTLSQILNVYLNDPLETLVVVAKKLFVAFDVKTNVSYPSANLWRETPGLLFSLLNYVVLGSALHVFFSKEKVNRREKVMFLLLAAGLTLPQMFVHVEWRYFLSTYIMIYMFFSYHFVGELLADSSEALAMVESSYLQFITLFVLFSFLLSLSIYA